MGTHGQWSYKESKLESDSAHRLRESLLGAIPDVDSPLMDTQACSCQAAAAQGTHTEVQPPFMRYTLSRMLTRMTVLLTTTPVGATP